MSAPFAGKYGSNLCEGDFDYNGKVDVSDLAIFATEFGRTDCPQLADSSRLMGD